jgi:hypothetical protein
VNIDRDYHPKRRRLLRRTRSRGAPATGIRGSTKETDLGRPVTPTVSPTANPSANPSSTPEAAAATTRPGGQILADALAIQGVDTVFGVPGESHLAVLDGLYRHRERIRFVVCRQEGGAAFMADAWARLTGKPGVAMFGQMAKWVAQIDRAGGIPWRWPPPSPRPGARWCASAASAQGDSQRRLRACRETSRGCNRQYTNGHARFCDKGGGSLLDNAPIVSTLSVELRTRHRACAAPAASLQRHSRIRARS